MKAVFATIVIHFSLIWQCFAQTLPQPVVCGSSYEMPKGYTGNQYYINSWLNGDVYKNTGEVVSNLRLRYNMFLDELIWYNCDTCFEEIVDKGLVRSFVLKPEGKPEFVFVKIRVKPDLLTDSAEVFAQQLYAGLIKCYALRKSVIRGYTLMGSGGSGYILENLEPQPGYILVLGKNQHVTFSRISKRKILKALPTNLQQLASQIIVEKNIRIHDELSLVQFVKLLEEVLSKLHS